MPKLDGWRCALLVGLLAAVVAGCDENPIKKNRDKPKDDAGSSTASGDDSGTSFDSAQVPGVCDLGRCPMPSAGTACCTPDALCGADPGTGFCIANPNARKKICKLSECPLPDVGLACCLPTGDCGRDPLGTSLFCFANPPPVNVDAGTPACVVKKCPAPDNGIACCTNNGKCGTDGTSTGLFCVANTAPVDAGNISMPPDDPSVDGQCPSFIGLGGAPVWGCCSKFGVCGSFSAKTCLLPLGTQIPLDPNMSLDDGGLPAGRCVPPK